MKAAFIQPSLQAVSITSILCALAAPALAQPIEPTAPAPAPPAAAEPESPASAAPAAAPTPVPAADPAAPMQQPVPAPVQQPVPAPVQQPVPAPVQQPVQQPAPVAQPTYVAPVQPAPVATAPAPGAAPNGPVPSDQPVPTSKDTPISERTGFYFHAGLGAGFLSVRDEYEGPYTGTETVKGTGTLASVRLGGGVGAGFVLGAGFESFSGTFDYEDDWDSETGETIEAEVDGSGGTGFFFAQKYLGPVFLRVDIGGMWGGAEAEDDDVDYGGFMLAGGLGVDFLVSDSWSLGGVAGVRRTTDNYDDDGDGYSGKVTMTVSSIQFSATYY